MTTPMSTMEWIKAKFKDETPLSLAEEQIVFSEIRKGNTLAKAKMLNANMKFVIQVAANYKNDTLSQEELVNEGAIGLWRALESFDATRGVRFITYAVWWIKAFIARAISEKGSLVRLPLNQQTRLHKSIRECRTESELDPDLQELNHIGGRQVSLSQPVSEDGVLKLEDILLDPEQNSVDKAIEDEFIHNFTNKLLNKLPKREHLILAQMYGLEGGEGKSIRELSRLMGLSRERIRQLRDQAVTRIKNMNSDGHYNQILLECGCKV